MLRCGISTSQPFRTPYSRLIGGILIHVVPFLADLYSTQHVWEGYDRWCRIEREHGRVLDNGRSRAKDVH